ncbi:MAG: ribosomal protein S18-alanine N-acetyltransferase [Oscillospiraceae bacterium]|nr:ribosomal protein S18-alanine N-acetyltransferase [Oscillospiraceae bacterium]
MIEYIPMTETHVAAVAKLDEACFSMPWSEQAIRSELTNPLALWLVAVDGETLVGYIGSQSVMGEADMMNVAVDPAYRRQGIGEKLITELMARLKENSVYALALEVRASNESAIALYDKLGFTQVGRRPNYYRKPTEDGLILKKEWEV